MQLEPHFEPLLDRAAGRHEDDIYETPPTLWPRQRVLRRAGKPSHQRGGGVGGTRREPSPFERLDSSHPAPPPEHYPASWRPLEQLLLNARSRTFP